MVDCRLFNVSFSQTNAGYFNISMGSIENVLFKDTVLKDAYFLETKMKKVYFDSADLTQSKFLKTSLNGVDLSNSEIEGIAVGADDIKGAVIEPSQAVDLLYLIGVKLKTNNF